MIPSPYYSPEALQREVSAGRHREAVGGLWEELGDLQLSFLLRHGMQPQHRLLDIGCGALRLGRKAVEMLESAHYFGLDISAELIEAGYTQELSPAQQAKLPRSNLFSNAAFDFSALPQPVDLAIAQSVFTHLPLNHIRRCLAQLAPHLRVGGFFFATVWLVPDSHPLHQPYTQSGTLNDTAIISTDTADPYHYHFADFAFAAQGLPYRLRLSDDYPHPRGQAMLVFERV